MHLPGVEYRFPDFGPRSSSPSPSLFFYFLIYFTFSSVFLSSSSFIFPSFSSSSPASSHLIFCFLFFNFCPSFLLVSFRVHPWFFSSSFLFSFSFSFLLLLVFVSSYYLSFSTSSSTLRSFLLFFVRPSFYPFHPHSSPSLSALSSLFPACPLLLAYLFWNNKSRLMTSPCAVCVSICSSPQFLIGWTNLYETWYAYHGIWAHLHGALHKSLSSVCVSACVSPLIVARQRLGNVCVEPFSSKQYTQQ
jgi:hypothetical protein